MPPVRWDTVQVDGKPMRVYLGVPDGKPDEFHRHNGAAHAFQNFLDATRYRERASRGSWGEMLAFFAQHLKT
jgi:dienelactone hydrolase